MSRQPASPVVRPLPVLSTAEEARAFVLSKPIVEDGWHIANFILNTYRIDVGGVEIPPLMMIIIDENTISGYLQCCGEEGTLGHVVDGSNVTTQVLCDDLPCAIGTTDLDNALSYLREFMNKIATDGYSVDEFMYDVRSYRQGARVDAIIDI